jgi:hypothetical protein
VSSAWDPKVPKATILHPSRSSHHEIVVLPSLTNSSSRVLLCTPCLSDSRSHFPFHRILILRISPAHFKVVYPCLGRTFLPHGSSTVRFCCSCEHSKAPYHLPGHSFHVPRNRVHRIPRISRWVLDAARVARRFSPAAALSLRAGAGKSR